MASGVFRRLAVGLHDRGRLSWPLRLAGSAQLIVTQTRYALLARSPPLLTAANRHAVHPTPLTMPRAPVRTPPTGSPLARTAALDLPARPGGRVPELHGERVAPIRLGRRPGILIDHQPVDRHRALGEPDDPDVKPTPGRQLQAHVVEQPADVWDSDRPVPPAPRPQPVGQRQQTAHRVRAQLTANAQVGRRRPGRPRAVLPRGPGGGDPAWASRQDRPAHRAPDGGRRAGGRSGSQAADQGASGRHAHAAGLAPARPVALVVLAGRFRAALARGGEPIGGSGPEP